MPTDRPGLRPSGWARADAPASCAMRGSRLKDGRSGRWCACMPKPLVSHQVIVRLIGATTTDTGLRVCCEIDSNLYPKGVEVSDAELQAINISRHEFHGEWNYTISPNQQPP